MQSYIRLFREGRWIAADLVGGTCGNVPRTGGHRTAKETYGFRRCPEGLVPRADRDGAAGGGSGDVHRGLAPPPRSAQYHPPNDPPHAADPAGHDVVSALPDPASCRTPQRVSAGHHPGVRAVYPCDRLRGPGPRKTVEPLQETAAAESGWPAGGRGGRASPTHPRHEASASGVSHRVLP